MITRLKKYIFFPLAYASALVNMVGLTIFRMMSSVQYMARLDNRDYSCTHPAVLIPAIVAGAGTAIIVSNIRKGELKNKILSVAPEEKKGAPRAMDHYDVMRNAPGCEDIAVDCVGAVLVGYGEYVETGACAVASFAALRLIIASLITYSLNIISICNLIFASISYQLGARTIATGLVVGFDCSNKSTEDEPWKKFIIEALSLLFMLGSAAVFLTYSIMKALENSKKIGQIIQQRKILNIICNLNPTSFFLTLLVAGFAAGFAPSNNYFAAKPSLMNFPFISLPSSWIEPLCQIAGVGATIQIIVGEMPTIYKRFQKGLLPGAVPRERPLGERCAVSYRTLLYITLTGIVIDAIGAALGAFRAPSFVAENQGEDPNTSKVIWLGIFNLISNGLKTLIFSGLAGLSDRANEWNEKEARAIRQEIQLSLFRPPIPAITVESSNVEYRPLTNGIH